MPEEFLKTVNRSEAKTRYWRVPKDDRDFFPPDHETFNLKFHDRVYELKVNHKSDIMTGMLYEHYKFFEGDRINIEKKDGSDVLTAKDTKPW